MKKAFLTFAVILLVVNLAMAIQRAADQFKQISEILKSSPEYNRRQLQHLIANSKQAAGARGGKLSSDLDAMLQTEI